VHESFWFTTRSTLFAPGDEAWQEIGRYEQPLRRLLARRYARALSEEDRRDLLQDILIEIREKLTRTFDPSKGKFRALLQTVVARRVVDQLRKAKAQPLGPALEAELQAPPAADWDALDLEAALIEAVGNCRDELSGGPTKDLAVLHALTDRLVHGMTATEIAQRDGVSRDRASRLLTKGRDAIFRHLLARELGAEASGERVASSVAVFKRMLRRPTQAQEHLATLEDAALSEQLGEFWGRFRSSLPRFEGDLTAAGRELAHGVELILGSGESPRDT